MFADAIANRLLTGEIKSIEEGMKLERVPSALNSQVSEEVFKKVNYCSCCSSWAKAEDVYEDSCLYCVEDYA